MRLPGGAFGSPTISSAFPLVHIWLVFPLDSIIISNISIFQYFPMLFCDFLHRQQVPTSLPLGRKGHTCSEHSFSLTSSTTKSAPFSGLSSALFSFLFQKIVRVPSFAVNSQVPIHLASRWVFLCEHPPFLFPHTYRRSFSIPQFFPRFYRFAESPLSLVPLQSLSRSLLKSNSSRNGGHGSPRASIYTLHESRCSPMRFSDFFCSFSYGTETTFFFPCLFW